MVDLARLQVVDGLAAESLAHQRTQFALNSPATELSLTLPSPGQPGFHVRIPKYFSTTWQCIMTIKVRSACDSHLKLLFLINSRVLCTLMATGISLTTDQILIVRLTAFTVPDNQCQNTNVHGLVTRSCFECSEVARSWSPVTYFLQSHDAVVQC